MRDSLGILKKKISKDNLKGTFPHPPKKEEEIFAFWNISLRCSVALWASQVATAAAAKSHQSCPTLCDPIDGSLDGSLLGSSVPGILQARTPEWVPISFSNA